MFNVTWKPANFNTLAADENPCSIDIVGNGSDNNQGFYYAYDANFAYFRIRLRCDPRMKNDLSRLENQVWGVLIKDAAKNPLFTARVNGKTGTYEVQEYTANSTNPFVAPTCPGQPIDTAPDTGNVEVEPSGTNFGSDTNYFLDFKVPLSCLPGIDFSSISYVLCPFTSDNANNINKEVPPPYGNKNQQKPALCYSTTPEAPALTASKSISPPAPISVCTSGNWTLLITVKNISNAAISNITADDFINLALSLTAQPVLTPSQGTAAFVSPNEITWDIGSLAPNGTASLRILVTGYFTNEGHQILNSGTVYVNGLPTLSFADNGIDVLPFEFTGTVNVSGEIRDCKTEKFLDGVKAVVYNQNCTVVQSREFDKYYSFDLPAGTYTIEFLKAGYKRKFLVVILQASENIIFNLCLEKKSISSPPPGHEENMYIFADVVIERIEADIIFNRQTCLPVGVSRIECLNDVIGSADCSAPCSTRLNVNMVIEKNIIYKDNTGAKNLRSDASAVHFCFPIKEYVEDARFVCYHKVKDVDYSLIGSELLNKARIKYIGYFIKGMDIIIKGQEGLTDN